jgi:methionyl-tRNA formyltransferase
MRMEQGLDTGAVYARLSLPMNSTDTAGSLNERLAALGGVLLTRHLPRILEGGIEAVPQDDRLATYAGKIDKEAARLDFRLQALQLERRVRAYNPEPGAWFMLDDERVKCWAAESVNDPRDAGRPPPGTIVAAGGDGIDVACGQGVIRLLELQRPGRGRVTASQFTGRKALPGTLLPA